MPEQGAYIPYSAPSPLSPTTVASVADNSETWDSGGGVTLLLFIPILAYMLDFSRLFRLWLWRHGGLSYFMLRKVGFNNLELRIF